MDIVEKIDLSTPFNNSDVKLPAYLNNYVHPEKVDDFNVITTQHTLVYNKTNDTWLSENYVIKKNEKKKRKKSKLSSDIVIAEDSNSSSEDDEPLTPTSSTIEIPFPESAFLEQHADTDTPKQDLSVKDTTKDDDVSTCQSDNMNNMQSIQTQSSLPQPTSKVPISSPSPQQKNADHKRTKVSWLSALFKPKKTISNIFSKKPPQLPKRITPSESPAVVKKQPTYTRYPLDVERSLYRLSHKKLANPRRPLQQQVVISNMMYWYLSIIRTYHPHLLHNKKTRYYTNVCQATYQSFAPPTPGTNFKHQPISHRRLYQNNTAFVVEKLNAKKSSHDKKYKHKPVRNTALLLDKNRFT